MSILRSESWRKDEGAWLAGSSDWVGVEDQSQGVAWVAMVEFKEVRQGLTWDGEG